MYVELGRFGGRSPKGTWLYSNYGFIKDRAGANIVRACVCVFVCAKCLRCAPDGELRSGGNEKIMNQQRSAIFCMATTSARHCARLRSRTPLPRRTCSSSRPRPTARHHLPLQGSR
eukprot:3718295-Alexandrium_andersonii.AAC.1